MDISITSKRLKELREERRLSHKSLAAKLLFDYDFEISDKQLMYIEKGIDEYHTKSNAVAGMATKTLYALAKFYNVSADYILGFTDVKSPDTNMKAVCEYTGLNEDSIEWLRLNISHELTNEIASCFNQMSESGEIVYLAKSIYNYLNSDRIDMRGSTVAADMSKKDFINTLLPLNYFCYSISDDEEIINSQVAIDKTFWENYFMQEIEKTLSEIKREVNK